MGLLGGGAIARFGVFRFAGQVIAGVMVVCNSLVSRREKAVFAGPGMKRHEGISGYFVELGMTEFAGAARRTGRPRRLTSPPTPAPRCCRSPTPAPVSRPAFRSSARPGILPHSGRTGRCTRPSWGRPARTAPPTHRTVVSAPGCRRSRRKRSRSWTPARPDYRSRSDSHSSLTASTVGRRFHSACRSGPDCLRPCLPPRHPAPSRTHCREPAYASPPARLRLQP